MMDPTKKFGQMKPDEKRTAIAACQEAARGLAVLVLSGDVTRRGLNRVPFVGATKKGHQALESLKNQGLVKR